MQKKRISRHYAITAVLILLTLAAAGTALLFAFRYYKLMRVNQFSKDIVLSDNYFLREYFQYDGKSGMDAASELELPAKTFSCKAADLIPALEILWDRPLTEEEKKIILTYGDKDPLTSESIRELLREIAARASFDSEEEPKEYINYETAEIMNFLQYYFSNEKVLLDVPHISQLPDYPNGCEAVSAVMLLQYYNFEITKKDFISDYLPREPVKISWGCRYGPNPKLKYAGDPASERSGWGCFAPVIVDALRQYLPRGYAVENLTGASLKELCQSHIRKNIPVAVWVTQNFSAVDEVYQWQSYDKTQTYLYPKNQHCVVLIGFDRDNYYFSDPMSEDSVTSHRKEDVTLSYHSMGSQAIAICMNENQ